MTGLSTLALKLKGELIGADIEITGISSPDRQKEGTICVLSGAKEAGRVDGAASAYVVPQGFPYVQNKPVIVVKDTRPAMVTLINAFIPDKPYTPVVSPRASVATGAKLSPEASVGDFAVVGEYAQIGANTRIYPNVIIGENVSIGEKCTIYSNVSIYDNTVIGNGVIIHSGAVIGADGFGFIPGSSHTKIPHIGNVVIHDNVEIGANSTIDRSTIDSTVIGEGTKIDNLVHIGHNVKIGKHCFLAGQCGVSGSSTLDDYIVIGGQVGIADHVHIGSFVSFAAKSGVPKDVLEKGAYGGSPVSPVKDWARQVASISMLPDLRKRVINLEKKLKDPTEK